MLRRRRRFHHTSARTDPMPPARLGPLAGLGAAVVCAIPVVLGFVLPAAWLIVLAVRRGDGQSFDRLAGYAWNSVRLGAWSAGIAIVLGLLVVFAARVRRGGVARLAAETCRAGYAIPGPVIAIGLLTALGWLDHRLNGAWRGLFGGEPIGLILTGSVVAVMIGYQTRFLAVAVSLIESGYARVNRHVDDAARTLGARPVSVLARVHVPALAGTLAVAALLVFVDVVKELPVTIMLRPLDFETLAARVYRLASEERLDEAATGALAIVGVGIVPVLLLARTADKHRRTSRGASR